MAGAPRNEDKWTETELLLFKPAKYRSFSSRVYFRRMNEQTPGSHSQTYHAFEYRDYIFFYLLKNYSCPRLDFGIITMETAFHGDDTI